MIKYTSVLIALAIMTTSAVAQPGAEPPPPVPSPPAESPPPPPADAPPSTGNVDLDALIAKVHAESPTITTVAKGAFRRARRGISVGPTVGLWSAAFLDPGDYDTALTFGLGVEMFKVPVLPDVETLKQLIMERVKAEVKDQVMARFQGQTPPPLEAEAFVRRVYEDVRAEILGLENIRAKTMERPKMHVAVEANRLFGAERWQGRLRFGIGIWKFSLGASTAFGRICRGDTCDDSAKLFIGPEVILHFMMSKNPRSSVVDAFVRFDYQATDRGSADAYDQLTLGVRYLFDVI